MYCAADVRFHPYDKCFSWLSWGPHEACCSIAYCSVADANLLGHEAAELNYGSLLGELARILLQVKASKASNEAQWKEQVRTGWCLQHEGNMQQ